MGNINGKKKKKRIGNTVGKDPSMKELASLIEELDHMKMDNSGPDKHDYMRSLVLLAVALGSEERCQVDIENKYNSNEKEYFYHYNRTGIGETKIFDKFSIATSEYVKKCYGIILSEEKDGRTNGVPLFIQRLIKKAYKPVFTFNMHTNWVALEEFFPWFGDKNGGVENISGVYLDRSCYVLLYLAYKEKRKLYKSEMFEVINGHFDYLAHEEDLEEIMESKLHLVDGYKGLLDKITFKNQVSGDVSYVFENIRLIEEQDLIQDGMDPLDLNEIRGRLTKMPLSRITNALVVIIERFGLSGEFLREVKLGNEKLEVIAKYIYMIKNSTDLTEREAEILFLVALVIYGIANEYNELRSVYYEGLKIKMQEKELAEEKRETALEVKYQKEIADLQDELKKANEKIALQNQLNKNKEQSIKQMELEQKRIDDELAKTKENDKELQFLREYYFNSQEEQTLSVVDLSMESVIANLKEVKGVIVGGHTNLTKKLKEVLPNFEFVAASETSRNLSFLRNKEIVFISSVHDSHGMYYKVIKEISRSNTALTYLEKYQNVDLLLKDIYEKCQVEL